jgi:ferrous iron transport protein A
MVRKLSDIEVGRKVQILSFEKDELFLKLMEMGCVPGETVVVEQIAPLGDPISIFVSGYRLSLRLNEASMIFVEDIPASNPINI